MIKRTGHTVVIIGMVQAGYACCCRRYVSKASITKLRAALSKQKTKGSGQEKGKKGNGVWGSREERSKRIRIVLKNAWRIISYIFFQSYCVVVVK